MRSIVLVLLSGLIASGLGAAPLDMKDDQGVRWICGGAGADERRALAALEPQANLKLLLVTEKRGGFLADVEVSLFERGAGTARVAFRSDGPICLLKAPAGTYRVQASFGGKQRAAQVTLGADPQQLLRTVLAFPAEPWDGVWASDEEKAQARAP